MRVEWRTEPLGAGRQRPVNQAQKTAMLSSALTVPSQIPHIHL